MECSVCFDLFNTTSHTPKNLKCGHTFCVQCIQTLQTASKVSCPKCRSETTLPDGDAGALSTNFLTIEYMEGRCENCTKTTKVQSCPHCTKQVCGACRDDHLLEASNDVESFLSVARDDMMLLQQKCNDDSALTMLKQNEVSTIAKIETFWDNLAQKITLHKSQMVKKVKDCSKKSKQCCLANTNSLRIKLAHATSIVETHRAELSSTDSTRTHSDLIRIKREITQIQEDLKKFSSSTTADLKFEVHLPGEAFDAALNECHLEAREGVSNTAQGDAPGSTSTVADYQAVTESEIYLGSESTIDTDWPYGIAVSKKSGRIVAVDRNHSQVITLSGHKGSGDGEFDNPWGVALNSLDQIFVADERNHRIQVLDPAGTFLYKFGSMGKGPNDLHFPRGLAIGQDDTVYICDRGNCRVKVVKPDGSPIREIGGHTDFLAEPWFLDVSKSGQVVVSDRLGKVYLFGPQGQLLRTIAANQPRSFSEARGVAFDHHSNIIVCDKPGRIVVLTAHGQVMSTIGSPGSRRGQTKWLKSAAVTPGGDIVVCDTGNNRIQIFKVPKKML